jgi:uncharacterized Tic20 family protein
MSRLGLATSWWGRGREAGWTDVTNLQVEEYIYTITFTHLVSMLLAQWSMLLTAIDEVLSSSP